MSRSRSGALAGARFNLLLAVFVSLAVLAASEAVRATPAAAAESTIGEGRLLWGVKESWRKYIALGTEAGDGATVTGWAPDTEGDPLYAEGFSFPVISGSFDDEANTTKIRFGGYAHFRAYCDTAPPHRCLLDTKYSDLELEIGPEAQILRGTHTGYSRTDPGGELHVDEDVVLAKYDVAGAATDFTGGASKWSGIPTVAGPGNGLYIESTVLDETSFEYTGPGGAPDLSEKWDTPGAPGLASGSTWIADPATSTRVLHPSENDSVVHTVDLVGAGTAGAKLVFAALDATTLQPVETPHAWAFPGAVQGDVQSLRTAFDPATDSVFFASYNEGAGHDEASVQRAVWDSGSQSYAVEAVGGLGPMGSSHRVGGMAWNPIEDELAVTAFADSASDGIYATDLLHRFRLEGGSWSHQQTLLRLPEAGEWAGASDVDGPFAASAFLESDPEPLAVARDGSYVNAGITGSATVGGATHYYPALHIAVAGDGSATVSPIAGTTTPRTVFGTYYGFASLATAPDGSLLLHNSSQVMDAYAHVDVSGGAAARLGDIVDAPADAFPPYELSGYANSMAADPGHGIVWATDTFSSEGFQLNALRGDELIGRYGYTDFPQSDSKGAFARLAVAPDGDVYLPIRDAGGLPGYRHLDFTGFVPELTAQPQDRAVVLGPGEAAETAQFAVAVADPGDAIQWQSKSAGASAFADLPGATAATLAVEAKPASDGTVYRAVVSNGAGRIASAEADLEVAYAPVVVSDLANREVTEGAAALFVLSADGNPEPQVQWQRRVAGFWEPIDAGDENFVVNGAALTVTETNLEQSGTLFRAKLSNSAGSVYSKQARLTVTPKTTIPAEGLGLDRVSLDWTGNAEMQGAPPFGASNYFSAGASGGGEATYSAAAGNARVFQVAPGGGETLATWATRGSHVLGGDQLVRLYGGSGRVEADGSATVAWSGAFSVNFYDGLVPFTFSDPELEVDADGDGTLSADLVGCASSMANPGQCDPMAPVPDVTVATFSGAEVDPAGTVEIEPDYAGVEVTAPAGMAAQNRSVAGWGAWPQEFVAFHGLTGLAPYWYSSGGSADPLKQPDPFLVDFDGEVLPAPPVDPGPGGGGDGGGPGGGSGGGGSTGGGGGSANPSPSTPSAPLRGRPVGDDGIARVAQLTCRTEGCAVKAPKRVGVKIDGKRFWAKVLAPKLIGKGQKRPLRVKLPRAALSRLDGRTAMVKVMVTVLSGKGAKVRVLAVRVRYVPGAKNGSGKAGAGADSGSGPKSAPITTAEPPLLARPATAVDVSAVKVSWSPRDSWVRYVSSGIAPGDGILSANGATGLDSTASACPDRPSTSDAQLPHQIDFAPKPSWYDPVSGSAGVYGQGSVSFRWASHGIDLTASDPEIEIAGAASRAIFRFSGSGGTPYPNQRASLVSLDSAGRPAVSNGGRTFTYSLMRGTLTADGVNVFAGFYTPPDNDEFGCVSVEFTTP